MKYLIVADLHLHHKPAWRKEWCWTFIQSLIDKYEDYDLVLLGDALEDRDHVDSDILNQLIYLIFNWPGAVYWVAGQHDSHRPYTATLHNLHWVKGGGVYVIDKEPLTVDGVTFVPFARELDVYKKWMADVPHEQIILTHMPTQEALPPMANMEGVLSEKFFKPWKMAISGDIHKYVDFDNLSYVGAPSQRDWRDKAVEGQIATLEDGVFTRIPTDHPVHIELKDGEKPPEDKQVIVKAQRGSIVEGDKVLDMIEDVTVDTKHIELKETSSVDEMLNDYVNKNEPPIDKKKALKLAQEIINET